jgi:hypothetical protein
MKKNIALVIVILVGCIVFAFTLPPVFKTVSLKKHGGYVESTVLTANKTSGKAGNYNVTVSFNTPDGTEVTAGANKSTRVSGGDKVMIWYDKTNPRIIDFGESIGSNLRGAFAGAIFFFIGFYFLIKGIADNIKKNKLIKSGMKISAEFVSVVRNEKYRMGNKNPWVIKCKWTDNRNGREYNFASRDCIIDPAPYLNGRYHVDVYINTADPYQYYMDTSFLPEGDNTYW